jgi:hypothetical protein
LSRTAAGVAALLLAGQALHAAERVGTIRGIVRDEQGSPLADVKVQMCGMQKLRDGTWRRELRLGEMPWSTTDKEGRFVVPVHEADLRFDFYCDRWGYAPTFLYSITNWSELNVVLKRGVTVTGTVKRMVGGQAEPVSGTQVELRLPSEDLWYQQRVMTDHDGTYCFHVAPPPAEKRWQVLFAGEIVQLDVKEGQPMRGPEFEITASVKELPAGVEEEQGTKL